MLAPFVLLAASLAGCVDEGSLLTPDSVEVTITEYPEGVETSSEINVTWDVAVKATANESSDSATFDEVGLVYSGNATASGENVSDYPNVTGQQSDVGPGTFTATFTVDEPGTIYVRAYASVGEFTKFSDTVEIDVGGGAGDNNTVMITDGPLPHLATYDPATMTISAGDSVVWHNEDDATHTATGEGFDTGDVASGEYSEPIVFDEPGEYPYECSYHPQTMQGSIIVEDNGNNTTTL